MIDQPLPEHRQQELLAASREPETALLLTDASSRARVVRRHTIDEFLARLDRDRLKVRNDKLAATDWRRKLLSGARHDARLDRDAAKKQELRNAAADSRGTPLRHRTDCSRMTVEQAVAHHREMDRVKKERHRAKMKSDPAASASDLATALSEEDLAALAAMLKTLDLPYELLPV